MVNMFSKVCNLPCLVAHLVAPSWSLAALHASLFWAAVPQSGCSEQLRCQLGVHLLQATDAIRLAIIVAL
jgi:hypothetical protein